MLGSGRPGPPWTVRLATWSARHRWPVFGLWFVVTIGVFAVSLAMGGTRTQGAVSQNAKAKFESVRAYDVFGASNQAIQAPEQAVTFVIASPDQRLADPAYAAQIASIVARIKAASSTVDGTAAPTFSEVVDPLSAPAASGLVSPDASTVRIVGRIPGESAAVLQRQAAINAAVTEIRAAYPRLEVHALNSALANEEISELVNRDLDGSLRLTIPITFAILLIAFGAFVAALIPLVLAISALLAAFGLLGIYSQVIAPVSPYSRQQI